MRGRSDVPRFVAISPNGGRVWKAAQAMRKAEKDLEREILKARAAGASWDSLAIASGINRETLRRRYGRQKL